MKGYFFILALVSISCVEDLSPTQDQLFVKGLMKNGPLSGSPIQLEYFSESLGGTRPVENALVRILVLDQDTSVGYDHLEKGMYQALQDSLVLYPGNSLMLEVLWRNRLYKGWAEIPTIQEASFSKDTFLLNQVYFNESVRFSWPREPGYGFFVEILADSTKEIKPYSGLYQASFPNNRSLVKDGQPYTSGSILFSPWDFEGTGNWKVIFFYANPSIITMTNNPVQGGILDPANGLEGALGIFSGVHTDTINLVVTF